MLKIKFTNGTEICYKQAIETEEYWNGASRRTLTFEGDPNSIGIDDLNALLSNEENLKTLCLFNTETGVTNIYEGYALKLCIGLEKRLLNPEANTYQDTLIFKLGKRTYIEERLKELGIA